MAAVNLKIDDLLLHSENPRLVNPTSQRDTLQQIIDDQEDKLAELAESIVTDGMSPIERILVRKNGKDQYVVLEGNRRTAALKLLANPAVLASLNMGNALQKRFERLAKDFDRKAVEPLACFEVPSDTDATKWIYLRHTGENEGKGVVKWSGLAAARFRGNHPALQALEFVREHGNLDSTQAKLLIDGFPITTLDRLLSTKEVRSMIGVDIKNQKLRSKLHGDELIKPLRRMVLDLAQKRVNVSHLKNRESQVDYIKSFAAEDKPNLSRTGPARDVEAFKSGEFKTKPAASAAAAKRPTYDPSLRKTVAPRGKLNISVTKISEIYRELRTLYMNDNPHACAVLLRVFLELSVDYYLRTNGLPTQVTHNGHPNDKKLSDKVRDVVDHMVKIKGRHKKDFDGVTRALNDKGSPLHIGLLHGYLHNAFVTPKVRDLRAGWDEAQPLFDTIWA